MPSNENCLLPFGIQLWRENAQAGCAIGCLQAVPTPAAIPWALFVPFVRLSDRLKPNQTIFFPNHSGTRNIWGLPVQDPTRPAPFRAASRLSANT